MSANYLPYEPQQMLLLPEALQDWLPEGHLAHFISDTVDMLDLQAFHARYDKDGPRNQPFHPAMMVKVLVYGYATGVFSSRKIARKLHEDVAFRVLAAGNFPAHRTIRDFRAFHLKELGELFVQVVRLAREMGLVKLGTIAVDGTKVKANASRHKAMSYGHMLKAEAELKAQIEALLKRAQQADEAEKNEPELDIPAEIARREARLAAIAEARQRLEQRQRDADLERGRDPDEPAARRALQARVRRARGQGAGQLHRPRQPHHEARRRRLRRQLQRADGGGRCGAHHRGGRADQLRQRRGRVADDAAGREGQPRRACPSRRWPTPATSRGGLRGPGRQRLRAGGGTGSRGQAAPALRSRDHPTPQAMAAKLQTDEGKAAYRRRKWIAEPPNGWIKNVLGFRQFSLRGLHRVQRRVEARVLGAEPAKNGGDVGHLRSSKTLVRRLACDHPHTPSRQPMPLAATAPEGTRRLAHTLQQAANRLPPRLLASGPAPLGH